MELFPPARDRALDKLDSMLLALPPRDPLLRFLRTRTLRLYLRCARRKPCLRGTSPFGRACKFVKHESGLGPLL